MVSIFLRLILLLDSTPGDPADSFENEQTGQSEILRTDEAVKDH